MQPLNISSQMWPASPSAAGAPLGYAPGLNCWVSFGIGLERRYHKDNDDSNTDKRTILIRLRRITLRIIVRITMILMLIGFKLIRVDNPKP